jgi:hypothetical protein
VVGFLCASIWEDGYVYTKHVCAHSNYFLPIFFSLSLTYIQYTLWDSYEMLFTSGILQPWSQEEIWESKMQVWIVSGQNIHNSTLHLFRGGANVTVVLLNGIYKPLYSWPRRIVLTYVAPSHYFSLLLSDFKKNKIWFRPSASVWCAIML